ncbi:MAG: polyhydroxyalkanoic acid system family protein [Bacteroidota bacterium]
MADIDISRPHSIGLAAARDAADAVGRQLREEMGARAEWNENTLRVRGRGVRGEIQVTDAAVRVTARLGLIARPFRNTIQREIEEQLDRSLSASA